MLSTISLAEDIGKVEVGGSFEPVKLLEAIGKSLLFFIRRDLSHHMIGTFYPSGTSRYNYIPRSPHFLKVSCVFVKRPPIHMKEVSCGSTCIGNIAAEVSCGYIVTPHKAMPTKLLHSSMECIGYILHCFHRFITIGIMREGYIHIATCKQESCDNPYK